MAAAVAVAWQLLKRWVCNGSLAVVQQQGHGARGYDRKVAKKQKVENRFLQWQKQSPACERQVRDLQGGVGWTYYGALHLQSSVI